MVYPLTVMHSASSFCPSEVYPYMHTSTAPSKKKRDLFIPIVVGVTLLLSAALLLFREVYRPVLKTLESGDHRFELRGNGALAEIRVYYKDEACTRLKVTSPKDADGVSLADLNHDGYPDLLVQRVAGDKNKLYYCWIWNPDKTAYVQVPELNSVYNITPEKDFDCILSHHTLRTSGFDEENNPRYELAEMYSVYRTIDGVYTEVARYAFTYYSDTEIYSYFIYRYDEEDKALAPALGEDVWMTPAEAEHFDLYAAVTADLEEKR